MYQRYKLWIFHFVFSLPDCMDADVHILFSSHLYEVLDFKCECQECNQSKKEFNDRFSICFIRTGNFYYHTFRKQLDSYTGSVLVSKPGYEYKVTHPGNYPDQCTLILFTNTFYQQLAEQLSDASRWFFHNKDIQSLLLKASPSTEYLHNILFRTIHAKSFAKLQVDELVIQLIEQVINSIGNGELVKEIPHRLKKNHLATIETAKQYINENFTQDISLSALADHCHVSAFHFSRIFKSFTSHSPYQYLQEIRLKNAELLLKTNMPVADIAFSSGFNSIDYFSSAFKKKYNLAPSAYRTNIKIEQDF